MYHWIIIEFIKQVSLLMQLAGTYLCKILNKWMFVSVIQRKSVLKIVWCILIWCRTRYLKATKNYIMRDEIYGKFTLYSCNVSRVLRGL